MILLNAFPLWAAEYYIDSRSGSDQNEGTSPESPWQTIARSQKAEIKPGDRILFARGGLWRETLLPHSGEKGLPVCYGAYGSGPLPKLYGSVDASDPEYWTETKSGIWTTKKIVPEKIGSFYPSSDSEFIRKNAKVADQIAATDQIVWNMYKENDVEAVFTKKIGGFKVDCSKSKNSGKSIQIWGTIGKPVFSNVLLITFRARCSKEFSLPAFDMILGTLPYTAIYSNSAFSIPLDKDWKNITVCLSKKSLPKEISPDKLRYHLRLGTLPSGAVLEIADLEFYQGKIDLQRYLRSDVGNIIFDHGQYQKLHRCGIKKWSLAELQEPGQYWYDPSEKRVHLRWNGNPARECRSIELALREMIISQGGCHDVLYENLAVAYGAAHGFGGGNTERLTIRNCDIYYIGGGLQFTRPDGKPVRFGNGIEFWGSCNGNLVENNRLWEIYDAALTNQGNGISKHNSSWQKNLIYRGNKVWNSEYSFEYWNRGTFAVSENIVFENNICWNAGKGWAHGQRPDPIGCHCMFSTNTAPSKNIVVRRNIFDEATECSICFRGTTTRPWQEYLTLDENQYYQSDAMLIKWFDKDVFKKDELARIQKNLLFEKNGKFEKYNEPISR